MKQYIVTGMTCSACQNRVEKAVSKVQGVTSCSVSLLTNSMGVEGDVKEADIIHAVEKAGYHAAVRGQEEKSSRVSELENPMKQQIQKKKKEQHCKKLNLTTY